MPRLRIPKEQIERCARIYKNNADAGRALGITGHSFSRLCREHGVETPHKRRIRLDKEARHATRPRATSSKAAPKKSPPGLVRPYSVIYTPHIRVNSLEEADRLFLPIVDRALALLKKGWTKKTYAVRHDGTSYEGHPESVPGPDDACQWCLMGAIYAAMTMAGVADNKTRADMRNYIQAIWYVANDDIEMGIVKYNDNSFTTQRSVIERLRKVRDHER